MMPFTWQRVLEHCKDPNTQQKVMDEILGAVSMLAQDQYGNYVVQVYNLFFTTYSLGFSIAATIDLKVEALQFHAVCGS